MNRLGSAGSLGLKVAIWESLPLDQKSPQRRRQIEKEQKKQSEAKSGPKWTWTLQVQVLKAQVCPGE